LKLDCEALKSERHWERNTNGKEAPPPLMVFAAWAGAAMTMVDAATAAVAMTARVRRTGFSFDG
jgi:hypothetical protein